MSVADGVDVKSDEVTEATLEVEDVADMVVLEERKV